jgi:hypothetical protein
MSGLAVAGTVALMVGATGTALAVPFPMTDIPASELDSPDSFRSENADAAAYRLFWTALERGFDVPSASAFLRPMSTPNDYGFHILRPRTFPARPTAVAPVSTALTVSVPDGGTTVILLGGTICGLVLLGKRRRI